MGTTRGNQVPSEWAVLRIACDPILIAKRARNICEGRSGFATGAVELDLHLVARRRSAPAMQTIIDLPGFCAREVRYNPFGRNDWIRAAGAYSPRSLRSEP